MLETRLSLVQHFQSASTVDVDTIEGICQLAIQVEVDEFRRKGATASNQFNTLSATTSKQNNASFKQFSPNPNFRTKYCKHHPTSTSHTTAECVNKSKHMQPTYNSKQVTPQTSTNNYFPNVTCLKCKQKGHYANQCPQRSTTSVQSTTAYTNNQNDRATSSWSSPLPTNGNKSSSTSSTTQRHSERVNFGKPPERYTPSNNNSKPVIRSTTVDNNEVEATSLELNHDDEVIDAQHDEPKLSSATNDELNESLATTNVLPETVFVPQSAKVVFAFNGFIYQTLLDSGASCSFIDEQLVNQFNLSLTTVKGKIQLAHPNTSTPRRGKTIPLSIEAFFLCSNLDQPSITIEHKFEVMKLPLDYQFIIGVDLIGALFPCGSVPIQFLLSNTNAFRVPQSSQPLNPITSTVLLDEVDMQHTELMPDMEGIGSIPESQQPDKTSVTCSTDKQNDYDHRRELLMNDSSVIEALNINEAIGPHSFCSLPESTVKLVIDPNKVHTLRNKQYPIANVLYQHIDEIMQRWLAAGKICLAPPNCQFNNPLTVAPKKDSDGKLTGIRICLDTRKLNDALIVNDYFPIPSIRTALDTFAGCRIFGEVDLAEAYLQFKMDEDSRPLTAFTWKGKQYMFIGCPFGLSLLPAHFQRVMSFLFSDLSFTFPYLDNLPIASSTWSEHKDHILTIIHRLNTYNLYIKPSSVKCGYSQMNCLGHVISEHGVSINKEKLKKVTDWPLPRTGEQLQKFLGFVTFLRAHVRHFADLTASMEAVKNQKEIIWNDEMKQQFELTKEALRRSPILNFPDFNKRFCF